MIELRNVTKTISKRNVLTDINLTAPNACITGLSGPNGSGKTMILRCACGLVRPTRGSIIVDGQTLDRKHEFPPSLGFLIESPAFLDAYTGFENLEILASIQKTANKQQVIRALERVELSSAANTPYKCYSLGMKQRLGIAAAVMDHPRLLVLDEPTNALDEDGVSMLKTILKEEREHGSTVLVASHQSDFLQTVADQILHVREGSVDAEPQRP